MFLFLLSGFAALTHFSAAPGSASAASAASTIHPLASPGTHGDLIVPAGQTVTIQPISGTQTYYQGGNVTVQTGGTLIVRNTAFTMVQFVADSGTPQNRLAHQYSFTDAGTIQFYNSTLTTSTVVLNAYVKLNLVITGTFDLWKSSFAFPGWINVNGANALLSLNQSAVGPNLGVASMVASPTIVGDTLFAPTLSVTGGAQFVMLASSYTGTYKDDTAANGLPGPVPLNATGPYTVSSGGGFSVAQFATPTDSQSLVQDVLYPSVFSGYVALAYNYSGAGASTASGTFTYFGVGYPISFTFTPGTGLTAIGALPASAVTAINTAGMLAYLNGTGDFGVGPSQISLTVGAGSSATPVTVQQAQVVLTPSVNYDLTASGAGTTFTIADSLLDVNWGLTPTSPVSQNSPFPWESNKVILINGATAFFANLSVTVPYGQTYLQDSAVLPDATSTANFYRWAVLPVTGAGNAALGGAQLLAYYAYSNVPSINATANSLNNLKATNMALWNYANYWDGLDRLPAYATTGVQGHGYLLVASATLTQSTLPDGTFLGTYHFGVVVPLRGANGVRWFNGSVTPYPYGLAPGAIDMTQTTNFPNYLPQLGMVSQNVLVNGVANSNATVAIGETLDVSMTLTDSGTAPVTEISGQLAWPRPAPLPPLIVSTVGPTVLILDPGQTFTENVSWVVNESVTGTHGTFVTDLLASALWNPGSPAPIGGTVTSPITLTIVPSYITFTYTPPGGVLPPTPGIDYSTSGTVSFSGFGTAIINATAIAPDGSSYLIGESFPRPGAFTVPLSLSPTMPVGTYTLNITVYYNQRVVSHVYANAFTIPGTAPAPPNFLYQQFFGLPIWMWLAIAGGIVAAVVGTLMLLQATARGKLVECGECGELIPETATVCPKCGAEFESNLVRCSRCSSTIPANSQVCPECAAQLLGKPEEAKADPERQGYADYVERFRGEGKKELGDNYSEGAFWDWWKRQSTYTSFSQWRLQQGQGAASRAGMGAPPTTGAYTDEAAVTAAAGGPGAAWPPAAPPAGRAAAGAAPMVSAAAARAAPPAPRAAPRPAAIPPPTATRAQPTTTAPSAAAPVGATAAAPVGGMRPCPNCAKEIPPEYIVCPFCGAVTQ